MSFPPPASPDPSNPASPLSRVEPRLLTRRNEDPVGDPTPDAPRQTFYAAMSARRLAARQRREANPPARRIRPRTILRVILSLALITLALFVGGAFWLRHAMRAALPQIDGSLQATGLSAPVTVTRDDHGVPSITAANLDDLLFAQGYITAQDRLWQMDALRRHASGELAEILGSKLLDHDRTQRTLQIRAAADRAVAVLPPDQLHQLESYAAGVNALIAQQKDHLPIEFHILHYTPAPWTPRDTLLVSLAMAQDLSTEFPSKLLREAFSAHIDPALLADLYPVGSWRDRPPGQAVPDLTSPRPEIQQIPLDETQSKLTTTPQDLLAARTLLSLQSCEGCRSGSNNWAVAGSRSASGQPLVSNDMHLALGVPGIWYEAALHTTDNALNVTGLSLPGAPFIIVGRNAHVAWSFTNLGADVQDIYVEHLRNPGPTAEFQLPDNTWAPVAHHAEHIRVRGGSDVTLDVQTTTHTIGAVAIETPIITPLYPSEHRSLSLAWTAYDPATITSPFLATNTATDGAALVAAFANYATTTVNLIYADDQNHIGYHAIGRIPIRGPALHHPIEATPEVPLTTTPPDDDDTETQTPHPGPLEGTAFHPAPNAGCPILTTASSSLGWASRNARPLSSAPPQICHPERRLAALGEPQSKDLRYFPYPKTRSDRSTTNAYLLETLYRPRRHTPATPQPTPHQPEGPIPTPTTPLNYTIGSPIPATPADALDPNAQWSGYIPYAELPAVLDPASGFLATANARITPDGYPYAIALNWAGPYRAERITRLLANASNLTPGDMLHMQMDVRSELDLTLAHRIAYALDHTTHKTKRLQQAADILRRWNGNVDIDAPAPAIIAATRTEFWQMLLIPQIKAHDRAANLANKKSTPEGIARLYTWGEQNTVLERLLQHTPQRWLPNTYANWNDLIANAVDRGLTTASAPDNLATWSYSKTHPVELSHPLLSNPLLAPLLGIPVGSGPRVIAGDTSNIKAISHAFGPSERFTADLSNPSATTSNITTGQSGNPPSPYYLDQLPHWLSGTTLPLPLTNPQTTHTLTLHP